MLNEENMYQWQKDIRDHEGDVTIRGGRQDGKSWAVAARIKHLALKYPGCKIFVGAAAERQEDYLIEKVEVLLGDHPYRRRKLKSWLPLENGTDIFKYPLGKFGIFVEGLSSVDFLFIEEAGHVSEGVFDALLPMLAEPRRKGLGWITLLGNTRRCKMSGFYYNSFSTKKFKQFHTVPEMCPHLDKKFLEEELERLGEQKYNVIYRGEFDDTAFRYFNKEGVMASVILKKQPIKKGEHYYLGIDPAGQGKCLAAFVVSQIHKNKIRFPHAEDMPKSKLTELRDTAIKLDKIFGFRRIFPDPGGLGSGLIDIFEEVKGWRSRIRPLDNRSKSREGHPIFKEDLYSNLARLIDCGRLEMCDNKKLIEGLLAVEVDEDGKIIGTDYSEAAVRAAWAIKEKRLKLFVA